MAVTAKLYGNFPKKALEGAINFASDTIKVMLCTAFTPVQATHVFMSDVTKTEVANGNGYTTRGKQLTTPTVVSATNVTTIDGDDTEWTSATFSAQYAIIYKDTGSDATSPLIGYVDFGQAYAATNGSFKITWAADGIGAITVA